ncbi:hypothetical protein FOMPIDRAFT_1127022 [Fomitopsis schrenkii]|uniref:Uncharacterized protein n=1 Tax=Fomitopsis schrenkii TaxID=2126942 RepID=S8E0H0_FOMSC|nr:hypothetical protein FOMPIDRAFT_1127022 [Fomitopsis schrenkii]
MFSQSYSTLSTGSSAFFPSSHTLSGLSFSDVPSASLGHQFAQSIPASQAEASSPEVFKQNIQLALGQVARVHALARNVLLATQHAYEPGNNPIQTAADMAELQQALHLLAELLRQSGVGALPLRPPPLPDAPSQPAEEEERLIAKMTAAVQALFEKRKRLEESTGVVSSLLAAEKDGRR